MTAIETKFIGPTDTRGSRVKALALGTGHHITIEWDHTMNPVANHRAAAKALITRQQWISPSYGRWIAGDTKHGYVFVCEVRNGLETIQ